MSYVVYVVFMYFLYAVAIQKIPNPYRESPRCVKMTKAHASYIYALYYMLRIEPYDIKTQDVSYLSLSKEFLCITYIIHNDPTPGG